MGNRLPDARPGLKDLFKGAHRFFQLLLWHGGKVDIAYQAAFAMAGRHFGLANVEFELLLGLRLARGFLGGLVRGRQKILEHFILFIERRGIGKFLLQGIRLILRAQGAGNVDAQIARHGLGPLQAPF